VEQQRTFQLNVKIFTGHNNNTITYEGGEGEGGEWGSELVRERWK
jgi:hypothetical protein